MYLRTNRVRHGTGVRCYHSISHNIWEPDELAGGGGRSRPFPIVTLGRADTVDIDVALELVGVLDAYLQRDAKCHGETPARVRELAREFKQLQLLLRVLVHKNFGLATLVPKKAARLEVESDLVRARLGQRRRPGFSSALTPAVRAAIEVIEPSALDRQATVSGSRRWSENPLLSSTT